MKKKGSAGTKGNLMKFIMVVPALFSLTANLMSLLHSEAQQIRRKVIVLLVTVLFSFVLMLSVWFSLLGFLISYLMTLNVGMVLAFTLIGMLNLLLLTIMGLVLMHLKIDPSFPETRKVIEDIIKH